MTGAERVRAEEARLERHPLYGCARSLWRAMGCGDGDAWDGVYAFADAGHPDADVQAAYVRPGILNDRLAPDSACLAERQDARRVDRNLLAVLKRSWLSDEAVATLMAPVEHAYRCSRPGCAPGCYLRNHRPDDDAWDDQDLADSP